jgi:hypothetical protein
MTDDVVEHPVLDELLRVAGSLRCQADESRNRAAMMDSMAEKLERRARRLGATEGRYIAPRPRI